MTDEFQREVRRIFWDASELPEDERARYLDDACGSDAGLRAEVESLLAADDSSAEFLERPAVEAHHDWFDEVSGSSEPSEPAREEEATPERIGAYRIVRTLGRGGMGVVYLAEQESPIRREVALKVIKLGMDTEEVITRFESERDALALMNHSNIARVYDSGVTSDGRPFFAMEHVPGAPITRFCDAERSGIEARLRIFIEVCEAVQHAHQKAIIHRDIKPSNVLVAQEGDRSVPKVIDFGIAKALHQHDGQWTSLTRQGRVLGTPEYMSPEQAGGDPLDIDTRTDVYSLGVLLYELLVGALPFEPEVLRSALPGEVQRILCQEELPSPSSKLRLLDDAAIAERARSRRTDPERLLRELRGDLDWIVKKALEKDRDRRYATAGDLAADVGRHLACEPVLASPPSIGYRLGKIVRRNRVLVTASVAVVLALSVGFASALWQYHVADEARIAAEKATDRESQRAAQVLAVVAERESALREKQRALEEKREALRRSEGARLTTRALTLIDSNPGAAALLAMEGVRRYPTLYARNTVLGSLQRLVPHKVLRGHSKPVWDAVFSPDGTKIASGGSDGTALILDAESGDELQKLRCQSVVRALDFHPDGRRLLTIGGTTAEVWDLETSERLARLDGHEKFATAGEFSPDGELVVSGSEDRTARVWRWRTGEALRVLRGHRGTVFSPTFDPAGRRVVTCSPDTSVRIWDIDTGESLVLDDHTKRVDLVRFSPSGDRVASAGIDATRIWNARTGECLQVLDAGNRRQSRLAFGSRRVMCLAFSADGTLLATSGIKGKTSVLRVETGEEIHVLAGHRGRVDWVAFDSSSGRLLTCGHDGTARIWDAERGIELSVLRGHSESIQRGSFSPDGRRVVTASFDSTVGLWDTRTVGQSLTIPHECSPRGVDASPDGEFLITAGVDGTARVWSTATRELLSTLSGHEAAVKIAVFGPRSRRAITTSIDGTARIWDWKTGDVLKVFRSPDGSFITAWVSPDGDHFVTSDTRGPHRLWSVEGHSVAVFYGSSRNSVPDFDADGSRLAVCWSDDTVRIVDGRSGELLKTLSGHTGKVYGSVFSPDGLVVATASQDGSARLWNAATGECRATLRHDNRVLVVVFDTSGRRVATASADRSARLWDVESGELLADLRGHRHEVTRISFSPDGRLVATGSRDETARLWESTSGTEVLTMPLAGQPRRLSFLPQGNFLLTCSMAGMARLWPVDPIEFAAGVYRRSLTPDEVDEYEVGSERERRAYRRGWEWSQLRRRLDMAASSIESGQESREIYQDFLLGLRRMLLETDRDKKPALEGAFRYLNGARLRRDSYLPDLLRVVAEAQRELGHAAEAIRLLEEALRHPLARESLRALIAEWRTEALPALPTFGTVDWMLEDGDTRAERTSRFRSFVGAANDDGSRSRLAYMEGRLLQEKGLYVEAARLFDRSRELERTPFFEPVLRGAECLRAAGEPERAEIVIRTALSGGITGAAPLWDLWFVLAFRDLRRQVTDVLAGFPERAPLDEHGYGADLLTALGSLDRSGTLRINSGGDALAHASGGPWARDAFHGHGYRYFGDRMGGASAPYRGEIHGTDIPAVYRTERFFVSSGAVHPSGYRVPVPPGRYAVTLHFAEIFSRGAGQRRFSVAIEGSTRLSDYEPLAAGFATADRRRVEVDVDDAFLDVSFLPQAGFPKISGLEIERLP